MHKGCCVLICLDWFSDTWRQKASSRRPFIAKKCIRTERLDWYTTFVCVFQNCVLLSVQQNMKSQFWDIEWTVFFFFKNKAARLLNLDGPIPWNGYSNQWFWANRIKLGSCGTTYKLIWGTGSRSVWLQLWSCSSVTNYQSFF